MKEEIALVLSSEIFTPFFRGEWRGQNSYGEEKRCKVVVMLLSSPGFEVTHKWDSSRITYNKHRKQRMNLVNNVETPPIQK